MSFYKRSPKTPNHGMEIIAGSFAPAGTGAVTAVNGTGFSVARTGVGEYTITFDEQYTTLISATASIQMNTATDLTAQFETYTSASKTMVLTALDIATATPTEIAADADNRVHFAFYMTKSTFN